ncbi:hypothetical protein H1R20_g16349, partial [Candolleomyces eurysporus]
MASTQATAPASVPITGPFDVGEIGPNKRNAASNQGPSQRETITGADVEGLTKTRTGATALVPRPTATRSLNEANTWLAQAVGSMDIERPSDADANPAHSPAGGATMTQPAHAPLPANTWQAPAGQPVTIINASHQNTNILLAPNPPAIRQDQNVIAQANVPKAFLQDFIIRAILDNDDASAITPTEADGPTMLVWLMGDHRGMNDVFRRESITSKLNTIGASDPVIRRLRNTHIGNNALGRTLGSHPTRFVVSGIPADIHANLTASVLSNTNAYTMVAVTLALDVKSFVTILVNAYGVRATGGNTAILTEAIKTAMRSSPDVGGLLDTYHDQARSLPEAQSGPYSGTHQLRAETESSTGHLPSETSPYQSPGSESHSTNASPPSRLVACATSTTTPHRSAHSRRSQDGSHPPTPQELQAQTEEGVDVVQAGEEGMGGDKEEGGEEPE